jgi:hypothetical protein
LIDFYPDAIRQSGPEKLFHFPEKLATGQKVKACFACDLERSMLPIHRVLWSKVRLGRNAILLQFFVLTRSASLADFGRSQNARGLGDDPEGGLVCVVRSAAHACS